MANAADLFTDIIPVRELIVGKPGSAKTGSLASLINAGFKLRVLAYDKLHNMRPLHAYADPVLLRRNVDIALLEDPLVMTDDMKTIEPDGVPTAYRQGSKLLDRWRYKREDGTEVDLGRSREWGPDTIVVLDSVTSQGDAAIRYARAMSSHTSTTTTDQDFNRAMEMQQSFLEKLLSSRTRHHVIVLAHLKVVSPNVERKGDTDLQIKVKEGIGDILESELLPSFLGKALPRIVGRNFDAVIESRRVIRANGEVAYELNARSRAELDLRLASKEKLPKSFDIADGQLRIFDALIEGGYKAALAAPTQESTK